MKTNFKKRIIKLIYRWIVLILEYLLKKEIILSKYFYKYNFKLFQIALRGIGVGNCDNEGFYSGEINFLKSVSQKFNPNSEMIIFDVGANVGKYVEDVYAIFQNPTVYAFEPHPQNFHILSEKSLNKKVKIYNLGLGEIKENSILYDMQEYNGGSLASIYKDVITQTHSQKEAIQYPISITTLDDFCQENDIEKIHLLKIDTEGNELRVLKGAERLIRENKLDIIQFEFISMNTVSRTFLKDFLEILPNYKFYRLLTDGMVEIEYNDFNPVMGELFFYQNIVVINKNTEFFQNLFLE